MRCVRVFHTKEKLYEMLYIYGIHRHAVLRRCDSIILYRKPYAKVCMDERHMIVELTSHLEDIIIDPNSRIGFTIVNLEFTSFI